MIRVRKTTEVKSKLSKHFSGERPFSSISMKSLSFKTIHDVVAMTNLPLWKEVITTRTYDEGLRLAALKIIKKIKYSKLQKSDKIFDDMLSGFTASGMNKVDADEATWKALGLIANGGANTISRVSFERGSQRSTALSFIASSMGFLDLKKSKLGLPLYSYPASVVTKCDHVKPYHFWMTAYLTRDLIKQGIDPDDPVTATYISQKGYQLKREIAYANNPNFRRYAILTRPAYDPAHQIVRTDLAFGSEGAVYGAQLFSQSPHKPIDVDQAIVNLLADSSVMPAMSKNQTAELNVIDAFDIWSKIFSPNSASESIKAQVRQ